MAYDGPVRDWEGEERTPHVGGSAKTHVVTSAVAITTTPAMVYGVSLWVGAVSSEIDISLRDGGASGTRLWRGALQSVASGGVSLDSRSWEFHIPIMFGTDLYLTVESTTGTETGFIYYKA
jgi:hypothetical protein